MPRVMFVNEHREVDVTAGRKISEIAAELGILVCREHFAGVPFGDWTVWVEADGGALSPPTLLEKVEGCKGWRRLANRARVLGDCKVYTQQGLGSRARQPRPIAAPPRPSEDPEAPRFDHEHDAAGTAWNKYGHPYAVGEGKREPPKYEPPQKKVRAKKAPAATEKAAEE